MEGDANEMNRRLVELADSSETRFLRIDYNALSLPEQVFRTVWELEAEVNNGGFYQYFWNSSGELVPYVVEALTAIGAAAAVAIVKRAIEVVGLHISWDDEPTRRRSLDGLAPEAVEHLEELDQTFFSYPDDLTTLLYRYVSQHRAEIRGVPADF